MKTKTLKIFKENDNSMKLVKDPNILSVAHLVNNHTSQIDSKGFFKINEKDFAETFGVYNVRTQKYKSKRVEMVKKVLSQANMITFSNDNNEGGGFVVIQKWFIKDNDIYIQTSEDFLKLVKSEFGKYYLNSTTKEAQSLLSLRSELQIPYTQLVYRLKEEDHRGHFGIKINKQELVDFGFLSEKERNASRKLERFIDFINSNQDTMSLKITKIEKENNKTYMFYVKRNKNYIDKTTFASINEKTSKLVNFNVPFNFASINEDKISLDWHKKRGAVKPDTKPYSEDSALVFGKEVLVLDFDKLEDLQDITYDFYKNKTLVQKTKKGIHVIVKNDLNLEKASTHLRHNGLKVDFRGLDKAYVKLYNEIEGEEFANFSDIFNLEDFKRKDGSSLLEVKEVKVKKVSLKDQKALVLKEYRENNHVSGKTLLYPLDSKSFNETELNEYINLIKTINGFGGLHEDDYNRFLERTK